MASFPRGFPTTTLCTPLPCPMRATCPAHLILLDFTTRTIFWTYNITKYWSTWMNLWALRLGYWLSAFVQYGMKRIHIQEGQCKCKLQLRSVRVTIIAVERQYYIFWVCVCSLSYSRWNAPYCQVWTAPLYNMFPHYLINCKISGKKNYRTLNTCFEFIYKFCLKYFSF